MIDSFSGQYSFLSNFHFTGQLVHVDGDPYSTVEHAFQAAKTEDPEARQHIRRQRTPGDAKRLGQRVILRADWDKIKHDVMLGLLHEKFADDPLRAWLVATRPHELVEGNTWGDTHWGVCKGVGENWLGQLLMQVRDEVHP